MGVGRQQGRPESIDIHVYNEAAAAAKASLVVAGKADRDSEAAVDRACQDTSGHKHRFDVVVPGSRWSSFTAKS